MRGCGLGRGDHIRVTGLWSAKADVFHGRHRKDRRILRNQGDVLAKIMACHLTQIDAINCDASNLWIIKAQQHLHDGGFPGARGPYNRHGFPCYHLKCDIVQRNGIGALRVMKRHRVKCDSTRNRRREGLGCAWVLNWVLDREQFNQAFGCPCGPLQFPPDFREGGNATRNHN